LKLGDRDPPIPVIRGGAKRKAKSSAVYRKEGNRPLVIIIDKDVLRRTKASLAQQKGVKRSDCAGRGNKSEGKREIYPLKDRGTGAEAGTSGWRWTKGKKIHGNIYGD